MTIPILSVGGEDCNAITETLKPTGTITVGGWQTTVHLRTDNIADDSAAEHSNGPTGAVATCPSVTSVGTFEVSLGNPVGVPASSDCQGMRLKCRAQLVEDVGQGCGDIRYSLYQGGTLKSTLRTFAFGTTFATDTAPNLTDAQVDAITNHDDLRIRCESRVGKESEFAAGQFHECSAVEVEYFAK